MAVSGGSATTVVSRPPSPPLVARGTPGSLVRSPSPSGGRPPVAPPRGLTVPPLPAPLTHHDVNDTDDTASSGDDSIYFDASDLTPIATPTRTVPASVTVSTPPARPPKPLPSLPRYPSYPRYTMVGASPPPSPLPSFKLAGDNLSMTSAMVAQEPVTRSSLAPVSCPGALTALVARPPRVNGDDRAPPPTRRRASGNLPPPPGGFSVVHPARESAALRLSRQLASGSRSLAVHLPAVATHGSGARPLVAAAWGAGPRSDWRSAAVPEDSGGLVHGWGRGGLCGVPSHGRRRERVAAAWGGVCERVGRRLGRRPAPSEGGAGGAGGVADSYARFQGGGGGARPGWVGRLRARTGGRRKAEIYDEADEDEDVRYHATVV